MARGVRLPLAPLAAIVLCEDDGPGPAPASAEQSTTKAGDEYLARRFGVARRTVQRWHQRGVDVWWADRIACAVGLMPELVWGVDYCEAVDAEVERVLGCPSCESSPCCCDADEQLRLEGLAVAS